MTSFIPTTEPSLFAKYDWHSYVSQRHAKIVNEISVFDSDKLLNTSPNDLCHYLVERYRFEPPILDESAMQVDQKECQVDISHYPDRLIFDRSQPFHVAGTSVSLTIPFTGNANFFEVRPPAFPLNPPRGRIVGSNLTLTINGIDLDNGNLRADFDHRVASIKSCLDRQHSDSSSVNEQLEKTARDCIEQRRTKLLADRNLLASLGYPLKGRKEQPLTYRAPDVRRRIKPKLPAAAKTPYKPEPVLENDDYEHILSVLTNMVYVMERSPSAFENMGEEDLRTHFIVQLNGHFEGQATGETFNYEGKTDILVRIDGRNIFIAECKFWKGPKSLIDTIDQILRYSSWRDTKIAIVIFNRQRSFTKVLNSISGTMHSHPNFKRETGRDTETRFRYIFSHKDDRNREMTITVMAFDVPRKR